MPGVLQASRYQQWRNQWGYELIALVYTSYNAKDIFYCIHYSATERCKQQIMATGTIVHEWLASYMCTCFGLHGCDAWILQTIPSTHVFQACLWLEYNVIIVLFASVLQHKIIDSIFLYYSPCVHWVMLHTKLLTPLKMHLDVVRERLSSHRSRYKLYE